MFDKDKNNKKSIINPIVAGVTGAVVGAGVAVAASQALKNKKTRDKVKKSFNDAKDKTVSYVQNFHKEDLEKDTKNVKRAVKRVKGKADKKIK